MILFATAGHQNDSFDFLFMKRIQWTLFSLRFSNSKTHTWRATLPNTFFCSTTVSKSSFTFILKTLSIPSGQYCGFWFSNSLLTISGQCKLQFMVSKGPVFPTLFEIATISCRFYVVDWLVPIFLFLKELYTFRAHHIFSTDRVLLLILQRRIIFYTKRHWLVKRKDCVHASFSGTGPWKTSVKDKIFWELYWVH